MTAAKFVAFYLSAFNRQAGFFTFYLSACSRQAGFLLFTFYFPPGLPAVIPDGGRLRQQRHQPLADVFYITGSQLR
jgi:hypothetical protein